MFNSVHVTGYQSLLDVTVEFGKFTVILGESNVGKTSLLRAIHALVENESGTEFVTRGKKSCSVSLDMGDALIRWHKRSTGASYEVVEVSGSEPQMFGKLGKDVPEKVKQLVRMEKIEFGSGIRFTPHFHDQFSVPFLLSDGGPRVAKILGELSGVNLLYQANQESNQLGKKERMKSTSADAKYEQCKVALEPFQNLPKRAEYLKATEKILTTLKSRIDKLVQIRDMHKALTNSIVAEKERQHSVNRYSVLSKIDISKHNEYLERLTSLKQQESVLYKTQSSFLSASELCEDLQVACNSATSQLSVFESTLTICPYCGAPLKGACKC